MFCETAVAHGLKLTLDIEEGVPLVLEGDPLRLQQILVNLVGNAVKFTERGGVFVQVSLEEESELAASLRFSVRDTGIGLDQEQQKKLFSAFSQADSSTTRRYGGTGLGLAIVKHILARHSARLEVDSEPERGSVFSAVFPPERLAEPSNHEALTGVGPSKKPAG